MPVRGLKIGQRVRFTDEARFANHLCGPGRSYEYGTIISKGRFRMYEKLAAGRVKYTVAPDGHADRRWDFALNHLEPCDNQFDLIIARKYPNVDAAIEAATRIAAKIKLPISVRAT